MFLTALNTVKLLQPHQQPTLSRNLTD